MDRYQVIIAATITGTLGLVGILVTVYQPWKDSEKKESTPSESTAPPPGESSAGAPTPAHPPAAAVPDSSGLSNSEQPSPGPSGPAKAKFEAGVDRKGADFLMAQLPAPEFCRDLCKASARCRSVSFARISADPTTPGMCFLKDEVPTASNNALCTSWVRDPPFTTPTALKGTTEVGVDRPGWDFAGWQGKSLGECIALCQDVSVCKAVTFLSQPRVGAPAGCYLKHTVGESKPDPACSSWVKG